MYIQKIVITGGPCAGKSTAMSRIQSTFEERGWKVLFISETATELITGGVTPWDCSSNVEYQHYQMEFQLKKEQIFEEAAKSMNVNKVLIVCDRGALDNKAYMSNTEFEMLLRDLKLSEIELRDTYDAVFHLVTAANGALDFYTTANNEARTETPEQAIELDYKTINAWTGHPHFRIIDNSTDFEGKMKRLLKEITVALGEPEPYEIERKFLIEYPNIDNLIDKYNCQKVDIIQTYLKLDKNNEIRIRQRGTNGHYIYYKTTKKTINSVKRLETETRLSQEEYLTLLMNADTNLKQIKKTRYCLVYENQYLELDIYPFWKDKAIVEIELSDEYESYILPSEFKVIKEVTDDIKYRNSSLAKNHNV